MRLRDHPLLSYRGYATWPPAWISRQETRGSSPQGEVGELREVRRYQDKPGRIFLIMDYEGAEYTGCLLMEYHFACDAMVGLLQRCYGMSMNAIGSLDLPLAFGTFRKAYGSQTWHSCSNCSHWPKGQHEQRLVAPETEQLCNECKSLAESGNCNNL
jgi:hypothetical protein